MIGANIMVELTKRVIEDMNERIKEKYHTDLPVKLCSYFDNGPECKNFTIMCYYTLLVEMDMFAVIDLGYLIAGLLYSVCMSLTCLLIANLNYDQATHMKKWINFSRW